MKGRRFINDTSEYEECDIPDYMDKHLNISRDALVEAVADTSEELMERYFAGEEFTYEEFLLHLELTLWTVRSFLY